MKAILVVKPKQGVVAKKEIDTIEFALEDINGVQRAMYDRKTSKVDVEYDDDDGEFDLTDLARAVQNTGKFQVISVG